MSLAAAYFVGGYPIVVGDIMVSIATDGMRPSPIFSVPTAPNVNSFSKVGTRFIVDTVQKLVPINEQLMLGWCGSVSSARSVINELSTLANPTMERVLHTLNSRHGETGLDLDITGIFVHPSENERGHISMIAWSTQREAVDIIEIPGHGKGCLCGSGAGALYNLLSEAPAIPDGRRPIALALSHGLTHLTQLAGEQMRIGAGIDDAYGGAFELATVSDRKVVKIYGIGYHFVQVAAGEDNAITITLKASLRISYFEDYLLVRRWAYGGASPNDLSDELYVIRPLLRNLNARELDRIRRSAPVPSMSNGRFSTCYAFLSSMNGAVVTVGAGNTAPIRIEETETAATIEFDPAFLARISDRISNSRNL